MPNPGETNKRHATQMGPKAHVNTDKLGPYSRDGDVNCAMCTAAGVLNLASGKNLWNTTMVKSAFGLKNSQMNDGSGDGTPGNEAGVDAQTRNLADFCGPMTGRRAKVLGSQNYPADFCTSKVYMESFRDGTLFAVNISGTLEGDNSGHRFCHWLNVVKRSTPDGVGYLEYVDFQMDHEKRRNANVARDLAPFIGISDSRLNSPEMVIVSFIEDSGSASSSSSGSSAAAAAAMPSLLANS